MRQLTRQRGVTLIELMVAITIGSLLVVAGLPAYADYIANSKLREGANLVRTATLFARSEAIKRNQRVQVEVSNQQLVVSWIDGSTSPATVTPLRSFEMPQRVQAASFTATFDSTGRPTPFGTDLTVALSMTDAPAAATCAFPACTSSRAARSA